MSSLPLSGATGSPDPREILAREQHVAAWLWRGEEPQPHGGPAGALRQGLSVAVCTYRRSASVERFLDSLATQGGRADLLVIVDASPDDETERAVRTYPYPDRLSRSLLYCRVTGPLKGLTRQRNFAMRWVETDLVAFFDDDVVLLPGCCMEMERAHRAEGEVTAGVGAVLENEMRAPNGLWRMRRLLGVVPTLEPGRYCRSGMSTPWDFLEPTGKWVEGDWLPGCAMMWKTAVVREIRFNERFGGYANGEDLEFSLKALRWGRLVVAGGARALHLHETAGRPDSFQMGYGTVANALEIHRRCLDGRRRRDVAYFAYAYGIDTLIRGLAVARPTGAAARLGFVRGRVGFLREVLRRTPIDAGG
ncbi:MAG TPA: glycosyltransferase [Gemmatimonadales bacterium]